MIVSSLLWIILAPIQGLIDLLPTAGSGLGINTLATTITSSSYWPNLGWANDYFPVDLAITLIGFTITAMFTMFTIRIALWLYHQFWGAD